MKIKVGDLLMNAQRQLGMVEGIAQRLTDNTQYVYWVRWMKDDLELWTSEEIAQTYRDVYLRYIGSNALLD